MRGVGLRLQLLATELDVPINKAPAQCLNFSAKRERDMAEVLARVCKVQAWLGAP